MHMRPLASRVPPMSPAPCLLAQSLASSCAGKRIKTGFTDKFLCENGAAEGSTVCMTDNGYMTEAAWIEISPKMAAGIRKVNCCTVLAR